MPYTRDDVGDSPGRTLSDAEKDAIAAEWNAFEAGRRDRAILAIKAEAHRRIVARYDKDRQDNMLARNGELQAIKLGTFLAANGVIATARDWTTAERAELHAIRNAWTWIKSVRAFSDELEGEVAGLSDEELATFDPVTAEWPE